MTAPLTDAQAEILLLSVVNLAVVAQAHALEALSLRAAASRGPLGLRLPGAHVVCPSLDEIRRRALESDRVREGVFLMVRSVPYASVRALAERASAEGVALEALANGLRGKAASMQAPAQAARIGADVLAIFAGLLERRNEAVL